MSRIVAIAIFLLGVAHIVFGILRFREPLFDALSDGFSGQFTTPEIRRTAFWFIMCGPLFMAIGHLAIRASAAGDLGQLRTIGRYLLASSLVGVAAFPASPLWAPLVLSLPLLGVGYRAGGSVRWPHGASALGEAPRAATGRSRRRSGDTEAR